MTRERYSSFCSVISEKDILLIVIQGGWVCEACADLDFSSFVNADKDASEKGPGVMSDMELILGNRRGNAK